MSVWRFRAILGILGLSALALTSCVKKHPAELPPAPGSVNPGSGSDWVTDPVATDACKDVPRFSLKPDRPSASYALPHWLFERPRATLATVSDDLKTALGKAGYGQFGFFCTPGGFALATQLERIDDAYKPFPGDARWNADATGLLAGRDITLANIVSALFNADPGRYRMLVFVVTDKPIVANGRDLAFSKAAGLAAQGLDILPFGFTEFTFTRRQQVVALIYEFRRTSLKSAPVFVRQTLPIPEQLRRNRVLVGNGPYLRLAGR